LTRGPSKTSPGDLGLGRLSLSQPSCRRLRPGRCRLTARRCSRPGAERLRALIDTLGSCDKRALPFSSQPNASLASIMAIPGAASVFCGHFPVADTTSAQVWRVGDLQVWRVVAMSAKRAATMSASGEVSFYRRIAAMGASGR
jgi:hypothetical protein